MKKIKAVFVYFLDYLSAKGLAQHTISCYRSGLIRYINFLRENEIYLFSQVNKELIDEYPAYLKKQGLKTDLIYGNLLAIKLFYRFILSENYINEDIGNLIEIPQRIKGRKKRKRKDKLEFSEGIRLFCKDCINFRGCRGERWEECEHRGELLRVI